MPYIIGVVIAFFLCLLLLSKKNKNAADYLLSFWMCWIGFHLLLYYLFITGKVFDLSLTDLAERLGTHPNYLSQLINEKEEKNFYDFVNSMRVEAFLEMAESHDNQRFTLIALTFECGFNSNVISKKRPDNRRPSI